MGSWSLPLTLYRLLHLLETAGHSFSTRKRRPRDGGLLLKVTRHAGGHVPSPGFYAQTHRPVANPILDLWGQLLVRWLLRRRQKAQAIHRQA